MSAPAVRRPALALAPVLLACGAVLVPPAAAAPPAAPAAVVRAEVAPAPGEDTASRGDAPGAERARTEPASRVTGPLKSPVADRGRGPLAVVALAVLALMGVFVVGLSRRPAPAE
ncbi:hypothetical protein [Kocuria flava]|uniref:Uncharacterized protein n=1 Tax=Kocuria flava TaxID=446860 RepID=A0A2N4SYF6_9MICC|nr:hypothetical protein [Kocuria flava]PLC11008.1 hypothetical protein AUQ48_00490 [Kocuria flava]